MRVLLRMRRWTIWDPQAPAMLRMPRRFRPLYRVGLPVFDGLLIAFSVYALMVGSRAVEEFTLWWFSPVFAIALGASAATALVGLVLDRKQLELTAKLVLVIGLIAYVAFLIAATLLTGMSAGLTTALALAAVVIITLRIVDLVEQLALEDDDAEVPE